MRHTEIDQRTVGRAASGDELAVEQLYGALWRAFMHQLVSRLHDDHDALTVFNDAFRTFVARLPQFEYRGPGQLHSYFKRALNSALVSYSRAGRRRLEWEREHLLPTVVQSPDGIEEERVELVPGGPEVPDPVRERQEAQAWSRLLSLLMSALSDGGLRLLEAYRKMSDVPGHEAWGAHARTGYVKAEVGLEDTAFYPAHNRFHKAVLDVLRSYPGEAAVIGLVVRERFVLVVRDR